MSMTKASKGIVVCCDSPGLAAAIFILLMWFLNIPLVNHGMVGFILSTMSVMALYLTKPPLLAFATSTFLATMSSAMSQVWRSRLAGLFLYAEGLPLLCLLIEETSLSCLPGAMELVLAIKKQSDACNGWIVSSTRIMHNSSEALEIYGAASCEKRFY